jgi:long-chain fatty acid transport protein
VGPPIVEPFSAKSEAPGFPGGNIGVTQDLSALGIPATFGLGFVTTSGGFADFRQVPESNGTNTDLAVFSVPVTIGVDLGERLSVGGGLALGIAFFDGPFVDVGGMTPGYGLRGTVGAEYDLGQATKTGVYYQTEQAFRFKNAVLFDFLPGTPAEDVHMDLPQNIGFGVANTALAEGRLLLAVDVLYKLWNRASLFRAIYDNQWVVQVGAQYSAGRYRLRGGYAWAENPLDPTPDVNVGGIIVPGDLPAVRYTQALLAIAGQHRISGGAGVVDLLPGIDFDLMAGGMFFDRQQLGEFTQTSMLSYWIGFGLTWRFDRGSCERLPAPENWCGGACAL